MWCISDSISTPVEIKYNSQKIKTMIKFGENVDEGIPQLDIPESPKIEEQESEENDGENRR